MLRIGLTGGIGSGKSVIAHVFEVLGIPVYYADEAAKRLMLEDPALRKSITGHFGEASYRDGSLDRAYLSSLVFNDPAKLSLLNSLVHPATMRDSQAWTEKQKGPYIIHEAALIFEAGVDKMLDHVIGVQAPVELRVTRVMERDGTTREEVMKRMNNQMDEETKMNHCDYLIVNDEQTLVIPQVIDLHKQFSGTTSP